jgi:hypothetical protein
LGRVSVPKAERNSAFGKNGILPENEGLRDDFHKMLEAFYFLKIFDYREMV